MHLQETLGALAFQLGQLAEEEAQALQGHIAEVKPEAQSEVGVGGPQMLGDQAVAGSPHLGGIMLTNLGVCGCSAMRS